ncbi:acetate--CoA ligase family protein [Actinomadura geliboluensis]
MTLTGTSTPRADRLDLAVLLNPRRVAVVGANDRGESFTSGTIINLKRHGFGGEVYPVNPRHQVVGGYAAYPDLASLPQPIDLSVLVVRAELVLPMLEQSVEAGAQAAIVVSSGFGEGVADDAGRRRAEELDRALGRHRIPILGPSTTGLVNLNDGFVPRAVTNQLGPDQVRPGPIALISQSGAANNAVFNRAQSHGVAIGLAVATGVQANVGVWDVARTAVDDPRITVLALIVEALGVPTDYEAVLRAAHAAGKPVILLRTGRSEVGRSAIATHTGSLAGNWAIEREMLQALGVTLVGDLDQLWEVAALAQHWGKPPARPLRLGVVGLSGGEGAVIADQASDAGMRMEPVSAAFGELVADKLQLAGAGNPFDPTGEAMGRPENALETIKGFVTCNDFDVALIALNAQSAPAQGSLLRNLLTALAGVPGRIAISYWQVPGFSDGLVDCLAEFPGPALPGSHRVIGAIEAWLDTRPPSPPRDGDDEGERVFLAVPERDDYWSARQALSDLGVPFAAAELTRDAPEALRAARAIGFPVVLKANVPSATHKAAAGLVRIGITDERSLLQHYEELSRSGEGVVVEQAVLSTSSLILGSTFDPQIGTVVIAGSGGSAVEQLSDAAVCPTRLLTLETARETLCRSRAGKYAQEREPLCFDQLAALMVRIGRAVDGQRLSVDLNPIVITPEGVVALDARIEAMAEKQ